MLHCEWSDGTFLAVTRFVEWRRLLAQGAVVVWQVEAASWSVALEQRHRHHGWDVPEQAVWRFFPDPYSDADEWEGRRIVSAWRAELAVRPAADAEPGAAAERGRTSASGDS